MQNTASPKMGYAVAALLGAFGGGLVVALATRAVPMMMTRMMTGMMQNMMARMKESGGNPSDM